MAILNVAYGIVERECVVPCSFIVGGVRALRVVSKSALEAEWRHRKFVGPKRWAARLLN